MIKIFYQVWRGNEFICNSFTYAEVESLKQVLESYGYRIIIKEVA